MCIRDRITSTLDESQDIEITSTVLSSNSDGKTIGDLITNYDIEIVAVLREHKIFKKIGANFKLKKEDVLIVSGEEEQLSRFEKFDW